MPADAVAISAADHAALLAGNSAGLQIVSDENGQPMLAPPSAPSLAARRSQALALLPAWEAAERAAGIEHAGRRWLTTPEALQDIRDALLAGLVPDGVWVDAAREVVPLSLAELQALWAACVTRGAAIYQRRLVMEVEIETMDAEQLAAFVPGWPA
ncbi:DUF4376 domain-containing protein [Chitiniphilus eburneus]|uniref:DUF4376 domain-containing protein n=2 Tax=Chitiniphilus eburneus TaxID=2571148 RepID=A0A4V5MRA2_9NEIS|nr:DUF4376 domain-containing protein [Chitiniphilus eburneus]